MTHGMRTAEIAANSETSIAELRDWLLRQHGVTR
jgi:hypothetical protein